MSAILGPGLHWSKPRKLYLEAIRSAENTGDTEVAEHLKIILELRDKVDFINLEDE